MNVIVEGEGMIVSQTSPNQLPRSPSNMSNFFYWSTAISREMGQESIGTAFKG